MSTIQEADDTQLLRRFVETGSQEAFREIMERHLNFVYSVCRREVQDATLAEDVTQTVFLLLARKAATIREGTVLAGWLFKAAQFASRNALRQERQRQAGEREVIQEMMHQIGQGNSQGDLWGAIEPLLNAGIAGLAGKDREAVLLRYFCHKSFKEVGRLTGTNEDTAQKRVARATEKLKGHLRKRGVVIPVGVLAALLTEQAVQAAPVSCAPAVAHAVFQVGSIGSHTVSAAGSTAGGGATTATVTLKGVLIAMLAKKSIVVLTAVLATGLLGGVLVAKRMQAPEAPEVVAVSFSPDGKLLLSGEDNNTVKVRDARTGKLLRTLGPGTYEKARYNAPAFGLSRDGKMLVTEGRDGGTLEIWDVASGRLIRKARTGWGSFGNLSFSPDGQTVLSSNSGTKLLDVGTGQAKLTIAAEVMDGSLPGWTALSPDGAILAVRNIELLSLWDTRTGKLLRRLPARYNELHGSATMAFSPGGELATGSQDGTLQFWDVRAGTLKRELSHGQGRISEVVFSPDGSLLGSGSASDGMIKIWDVRSGQLRHQLVHKDLRCMAFSPDNKTLVASSRNNTTKVWDTSSGKERPFPE